MARAAPMAVSTNFLRMAMVVMNSYIQPEVCDMQNHVCIVLEILWYCAGEISNLEASRRVWGAGCQLLGVGFF